MTCPFCGKTDCEHLQVKENIKTHLLERLPKDGGDLEYTKGSAGWELKLLNDGYNQALSEVRKIVEEL